MPLVSRLTRHLPFFPPLAPFSPLPPSPPVALPSLLLLSCPVFFVVHFFFFVLSLCPAGLWPSSRPRLAAFDEEIAE